MTGGTVAADRGWSGGRRAFGDFAPGLVHYTDRVLFDEVWARPGLPRRDRSLLTIAALTAMGRTEQLEFHLGYAAENGVTVEELKEALLHLSFYAGWPNGMGAMAVAKRLFEDEPSHDADGGHQDDTTGYEEEHA